MTKAIEDMAKAYEAAWCSGDPTQVAAHFAADGFIQINRGDVLKGEAALREMAAGFYAAFPDLKVICDGLRTAGDHVVFLWTLEGHHAETKNFVRASGWEEWNLTPELKIESSLGWFDADDYQRQIDGA